MFDRIRKALGGGHDTREATPEIDGSGPNLSAVPPFAAKIPGGLAAVDPALIGRYVGLPVASVVSLDNLGPEPTGFLGSKIRDRLGDLNGDSELQPGEIAASQSAAREARMRASGMTEEQIAMIRDRIGEAAAQHRQNAWAVNFCNGRRASVQVFELADDQGEFGRFKARYDYQFIKGGKQSSPNNLFEGQVHDVRGAHYESYRLGGVVVAVGRKHEAVARCGRLEAPHSDRTLAALAALGLWAVEG
jgi:hypothetical protein